MASYTTSCEIFLKGFHPHDQGHLRRLKACRVSAAAFLGVK
jgi:hypothetical protein